VDGMHEPESMCAVTGVKDYPARLTEDLRRDSRELSKL
jgi:hypothetical protein